MWVPQRVAILNKLADLIEAEVEPLARLLTLEQGKSLTEAKGEVNFSAAYVRWFAEEAQRVTRDQGKQRSLGPVLHDVEHATGETGIQPERDAEAHGRGRAVAAPSLRGRLPCSRHRRPRRRRWR